MDHVGMDLGKRESQIAILTDDGELINMRIRTERHRLVEVFGRRPKAKKIRSIAVSRGRGWCAFHTASCCRSARFSSANSRCVRQWIVGARSLA